MSDSSYTPEERRLDNLRIRQAQEEFERSRTWPSEPPYPHDAAYSAACRADLSRDFPKRYPENPKLLAAILADPDSDPLRREYAAWMKQQPDWGGVINGEQIAEFIDTQQNLADAWRANPKADVTPLLTWGTHKSTVSNYRGGVLSSYGDYDIESVADIATAFLFYRGFIEHIAIKARDFVKFADEIFALAPIRHLTLTYCADYIEQLAASPYLAQIRSLELPNRMMNNHYTRLNDLTDEHIRILASSPHLRELKLLDLEDNTALTERAFDHLALSQNLPSLSLVRLDVWDYRRELGDFGDYSRELLDRRPATWAPALEARHGYLPWLHAEEHYGTPNPDKEIPVVHPVGVAAFRPDVAARRRSPLPAALVDAINASIAFDPGRGHHVLRDRALIVPLPGGRLVATLEAVTPDPSLPDLRVHVRMTIQTAPDGLRLADQSARPRTTLTFPVPIR